MNGVHERGKFLEVMIKNTYVSQTAMYSNIEMLPSPLKSAFSKISQRAKHGVDYLSNFTKTVIIHNKVKNRAKKHISAQLVFFFFGPIEHTGFNSQLNQYICIFMCLHLLF